MATRAYEPIRIEHRGDNAHVIKWEGLLVNDDGAPLEMPGSERRSVQIVGTLGPAGKVVIEGSNDGATYATLSDEFGNDLGFSGLGISTVAGVTRFIRPRVTAGGGTLDIDVYLLVRKEGRK